MIQNLNDQQLMDSIREIARKNTTKNIIPGENYIPVTGKVLDEDDILIGVDSMLDAWLTAGRYSEEFEKKLARYMGSRFSFLVNSGSSANLLAFYALTSPKLGNRAIKPGDEIITVNKRERKYFSILHKVTAAILFELINLISANLNI